MSLVSEVGSRNQYKSNHDSTWHSDEINSELRTNKNAGRELEQYRQDTEFGAGASHERLFQPGLCTKEEKLKDETKILTKLQYIEENVKNSILTIK